MTELTETGRRKIEEIAARHGVSPDAALTVLSALVAGHGNRAQFSHPELGGMGQWSRGGMVMIGDMFNNALKARVDGLCTELSALIDERDLLAAPAQAQGQSQGQSQGSGSASLFVPGRSASWWPSHLGVPSSVGAQNDLRYAYFPASRRLAIDKGGRVSVYDTGEHQIFGVSQQQGGDQSITFTSQLGLVRVADLPLVGSEEETGARPSPPQAPGPARGDVGEGKSAGTPRPPEQPTETPAGGDDIFAKIERLAELHRKGILTEREYEAKKSELLARL